MTQSPDLSAGACLREADTDLHHRPERRYQRQAVTVCARCPVQQACLDNALELERGTRAYARQGIYGGLTPDERFDLDRLRWPDSELVVARSGVHAKATA